MDKYEILEELNSGCFGKVYKIRRKYDGRILVWKEISYKKFSEKENKLLITEVNVMRELKSCFIVKYIDRINIKEQHKMYIIMEYCEKGDLKQYIEKHKKDKAPIPEEFIWRILSQMCAALEICHSSKNKVIHRDIKPGNIFIDKYDDVKLGDFGLSKKLAEDSIFAQTNVGTPYYMSPEQVSTSKYDEKTDIWSLGCILYEMAALKVPFQACNYLKLAEVISKAKKADIPDIYSDRLRKVIDWMTTKNPEDRPSATQLLSIPNIKIIVQSSEILVKNRALKKREELLDKREEELNQREAKINQKYEEFKKEKAKHEFSIKQMETLNLEFEKKKNPTRNFMNEYNTQINKSYKGISDTVRLNNTVDDQVDASAMFNSQDQQVRGSLKYNMLYNKNNYFDEKENINTSNNNLLLSNSSLSKHNITGISNRESKSGSNNFEDSQSELSRSKTKMKSKDYPNKKIKINLYSEENSSESFDIDKSKSNLFQKCNQVNVERTSIITAPSSGLNSGTNNALSKHLAAKSIERLSDKQNTQVNTSNNFPTGLPPKSQNFFQRDSNVERSIGSNMPKCTTNSSLNVLRRNFSTNHIDNSDECNESNDLLEPRISIPTFYRKEMENRTNNEDPHSTDNTFSIFNCKPDRENSLENPQSIKGISHRLFPSKGAEAKPKPSLTTKSSLALKNFTGKNNLTLGRTLSRGKLVDNGYKGQQISIKELLSKGNATIKKHGQGNILGNITVNSDAITPK